MEGATTEIGPLLLKGVKTGRGYSGAQRETLFRPTFPGAKSSEHERLGIISGSF